MSMHRLLDFLPFVLLTSDGANPPKIKANITRILEGLLIAVVTAAFSSYILLQRLDVKVETVCKKVDKIEADLPAKVSRWELDGKLDRAMNEIRGIGDDVKYLVRQHMKVK